MLLNSRFPRPSWLIYSEKLKVLVTQSCPTLHDPMNCSPPGSSVHGIFHAGIPEWVAIPFSKWSSPYRDSSCIGGGFFTIWPTRQAPHVSCLPLSWPWYCTHLVFAFDWGPRVHIEASKLTSYPLLSSHWASYQDWAVFHLPCGAVNEMEAERCVWALPTSSIMTALQMTSFNPHLHPDLITCCIFNTATI